MAAHRKRRSWSARDVRQLRTMAKKASARTIGSMLSRTEGAVRQKALGLGISLDTRKRRGRK
jgi:hypothetical protein